MPMRFQNVDYQARALNRLARRASRHGFKTMVDSLNRAQWKIWAILDMESGRTTETTRTGYNMRSTL